MDPHRRSVLRSIAYHRRIAERIADDPSVLAAARARVRGWQRDDDPTHADHARAWAELLDGEPAALCAALVRDDDTMQTLRSCSPFAGALDPRERWAIFRAVNAETAA